LLEKAFDEFDDSTVGDGVMNDWEISPLLLGVKVGAILPAI
jgi:hypothetical protein